MKHPLKDNLNSLDTFMQSYTLGRRKLKKAAKKGKKVTLTADQADAINHALRMMEKDNNMLSTRLHDMTAGS